MNRIFYILLLLTIKTVCCQQSTTELNDSELDAQLLAIFGNGTSDSSGTIDPANSFNNGANDVQNNLNEDPVTDNIGISTSPPFGDKIQASAVHGAETGTRVGDCTCVPYYLCKNDSTINNDGVGLIDIRIKEKGKCKSYLDVCCESPTSDPNDKVTPSIPNKAAAGCGYRNPEGVGFRITGAKQGEAQFGEFPWMIAVLREETLQDKKIKVYQCGGSLIHPRVVLTAAHCVSDPAKHKLLRIRAGEWDTQTKNELYPHQERNVQNVIIHRDFNSGSLYNDIALLFLDEPVQLAENVDIICLPKQDMQINSKQCFASGWGKNSFGAEGVYQVILKRVKLPIVPHDICQEQLRHTRLSSHFILHHSFICAGGEQGEDTCKGDGGSPLVCPVEGHANRYQQAGIVAWGIGCGDKDVPGVYASVAKFREWIREQLIYEHIQDTQFDI